MRAVRIVLHGHQLAALVLALDQLDQHAAELAELSPLVLRDLASARRQLADALVRAARTPDAIRRDRL